MATKRKTSVKKGLEITTSVATTTDKTIQITFTIPAEIAKKNEEAVFNELAKNISVKGFRKGRAPKARLKEKIERSEIVEKVVNRLMPYAMAAAIAKHKIKPVVPANLQVLRAPEKGVWEVRATTCELPEIELGSYKKAIRAELAKAKKKVKKELAWQEKEVTVIATLLKAVEIIVPAVIVQSEADVRIRNLGERLDKLGLTFEKYLQSLKKKPEEFEKELVAQTTSNIKLELTLNKIAEVDNIKVDKTDVDKAVEGLEADPNSKKESDPKRRRRYIELALTRRAALDSLVMLAAK